MYMVFLTQKRGPKTLKTVKSGKKGKSLPYSQEMSKNGQKSVPKSDRSIKVLYSKVTFGHFVSKWKKSALWN